VKKFKIKSFCKVNLSLRVLQKIRSDYHKISSVITFCNLHDVIFLSKIKGKNDKISFSGKFKNGISKKNNTVSKILRILRKRNIIKKQRFKINIKKNIPQGSGLGGGSSNAANLLNFLNNNMNLKLNKKTKYQIARQVGFDVPICLERKNTVLNGKKNEIIRLKKKLGLIILIVYPNILCSTKKIYYKNKQFTNSYLNIYLGDKKKEKIINMLQNERNDLENIVIKFYPKIGKIINLMKNQEGCYFSRITGSGSACIGIFSNTESAIYTKRMLRVNFPNYWYTISKTI
tara:strand:+ start:662 stop:1525 length:864 start_codon:yes stop_codon:yes gene_type:complete